MEEKNFNLKNFTPNKKLLMIVGVLILIPTILLVIIKFSPSHRQIDSLKNISKDVESINNSLNSSLEGDTLDMNKAEPLLTEGLLSLKKSQDQLISLDVEEKNKALKATLKETLDFNVLLFEKSLSLIKDPFGSDFSERYTDYLSSLKNFEESSKETSLKGIPYPFNNTQELFFTNLKNYINELIKINGESEIKSEQKREFYISADSIISELNSLNNDYKPAIERFRRESKDLTPLIDDVKKDKNTFSLIKSKVLSMTIPENTKGEYNLLLSTVDLYELYIKELEYSLLIESSQNAQPTTVTSNYSNAYSKYEDYLKNYSNLRSTLDKLKNN